MIQINNSGSLVIPQKTYSGIWIQNINIMSPSPIVPISAIIRVCPMDGSTGEIAPALSKTINVRNVSSSSMAQPEVDFAMNAILNAVQALVISGSTFRQ